MIRKGIRTRLVRFADRAKANLVALWLASRDPRTPISAKIVATLTIAYGLSPIDLIPDFIPVLGYLDDLLLLPAGIWLAVRMIPDELWEEFRARGEEMGRSDLPISRAGAVIIVILWILALSLVAWLVLR